jgi:hypothetical protein
MSRTANELGYIEADVTLRRTEDGGRSVPIRSGYRPNWWLPNEAGDAWAAGSVELCDRDQLPPGATASVRIYPFVPEVWDRVRPGSSLELCEGPVLVGKATVRRIVPAAMAVGSR